MKKIIFLLFLIVSFSAKSQSDTTIQVSAQELSNLFSTPKVLLSPSKGYTYYATSIVVYFKGGDKKYLPCDLLIAYQGCSFNLTNLSQVLSLKTLYMYNAINSIPDVCYGGAPLVLKSSSNTGNGSGTMTLYISYFKIKN